MNGGSGGQGSEVKGAPKTSARVNPEPVNAYQKHQPFSLEEERADVFTFGKDKIGLLDIVILDAIANSKACNY